MLSSNFGTNEILEFDSSGNGSILYDSSDGISGPYGLVFDSVGNLIVSQPFSDQVLSIPSNGGAATVLADSGDGLLRPLFLGLNTNGDLLVADDLASTVFSIDPGGVVTVFDVLPETPGAIAVRSNGDIYLVTVTSCINLYRYPAGDASQRTLFATFSSLTIAAQLVFSLDGSSLYLTSYDQGGLIEIDPDTASTTQRIKQGMKLNHARGITVFGMYLHPSWSNYGSGVPGTKGVPALTSQGDPFLGSTVTVDLENSYGQPTIGLLFVGFQQARDLSFSGGGVSFGGQFVSKLFLAAASYRVGGSMHLTAGDTLLGDAGVPSKFGASIAYVGSTNTTIAIRTSFDGWSALNGLGSPGLRAQDTWDSSIGADIAGPRVASRPLMLRVGARLRDLPFEAAGRGVTERSVMAGLGTFWAQGHLLTDLAVIRADRDAGLPASEQAWTLSIGVTIRP